MKLQQIIESGDYNIVVNDAADIFNGIVFLYPAWSIDQRYLLILLNKLKKMNSSTVVFILDLEDESSHRFQVRFGLQSHGNGEIYYIKNGVLLHKIEMHDDQKPEVLIDEFLGAFSNSVSK